MIFCRTSSLRRCCPCRQMKFWQTDQQTEGLLLLLLKVSVLVRMVTAIYSNHAKTPYEVLTLGPLIQGYGSLVVRILGRPLSVKARPLWSLVFPQVKSKISPHHQNHKAPFLLTSNLALTGSSPPHSSSAASNNILPAILTP